MTYIISTLKGKLRASDTDYADVRKKPVLSIEEGNSITKLASFNDVEAMNKFVDVFTNIKKED